MFMNMYDLFLSKLAKRTFDTFDTFQD